MTAPSRAPHLTLALVGLGAGAILAAVWQYHRPFPSSLWITVAEPMRRAYFSTKLRHGDVLIDPRGDIDPIQPVLDERNAFGARPTVLVASTDTGDAFGDRRRSPERVWTRWTAWRTRRLAPGPLLRNPFQRLGLPFHEFYVATGEAEDVPGGVRYELMPIHLAPKMHGIR